MESQRYKNLLQKASGNNLTINDINEMFLAINDKSIELRDEIVRNSRSLKDIEEEYPLLPPEADDLSKAVKRRGVYVLGGKKSPAYKNVELRRRVYRDIYGEVKRQYGLIKENGGQESYKKLKRKHLQGAFSIVDAYTPPIAIENDIIDENDLADID